ncbi:MAG TPA: PEGA domain-containing protein [Terriglobales bacterium]|nr:PEGA domain-containing protein [Terriglobales bacterium]
MSGKSRFQIQVGTSTTPEHVEIEPINVPDEFAAAKFGKQVPGKMLTWPPEGQSLVRVTIGTLKQIGAFSGEDNFTADVLTENAWIKPIHLAAFHVYFYDNQNVRIGESYLSVNDLPVNTKAKSDLNVRTRGKPSRLELVAVNVPDEFASFLPKKEIPITVNSVPQGALLRLDGEEQGTTPKIVKFVPGKHLLTFSLPGYGEGKYPFEVKPDDAPGGSITLELGSAMHDTVELRDGSVLTGDVEAMSATEVEIRIGGSIQKVNRNSVKRILLIERMPVAEPQQAQ